jgi:UDP-N-acetylglucosamine 4,6-dehydratase
MAVDLSGAAVLITGGTGSFGTAMARRLLERNCGQVRILSRDEAKQDEMRRVFADDRLRFCLGDVRDFETVKAACRGVDYIFHAAALKQVPSCEFFPLEAVRTNVIGSSNVVEAARANEVRTVVCLSTDKAVSPINAMGMSKALMEKIAQASVRSTRSSSTSVCTVRYGNVLCSRGSVVPLFIEQLRHGRPLTVTNPDMTRFLMSLDEAILLVEHAWSVGRPGDLFVRKAPASTVGVLAAAIAELFGVAADIKIVGTRHGEKLYETLASQEEMARAEDHGEFFRIPIDDRGLNYDLYFNQGNPLAETVTDYNSHNTELFDVEAVRHVLLTVPEIKGQLQSEEKIGVAV